ncbi:MAG: hypothetical protein ABIP97_12185, partial [Chthoniobacterales bacterium]
TLAHLIKEKPTSQSLRAFAAHVLEESETIWEMALAQCDEIPPKQLEQICAAVSLCREELSINTQVIPELFIKKLQDIFT